LRTVIVQAGNSHTDDGGAVCMSAGRGGDLGVRQLRDGEQAGRRFPWTPLRNGLFTLSRGGAT
jgi:hypothetical protein